jgi:hypothetical protein
VVSKPLLAGFAVAFSLHAQAQAAYAPPNFTLSMPSMPSPANAPPLPFRYVGRLSQNGRSEVLLMRGAMLHSVAEGDEIDGEYRVERISGASVHFTYLPGGMKQNLDLTAASR